MEREQKKGAADTAKGAIKKGTAGNGTGNQAGISFEKPLGSAHNDVADIRDVAREAAKK
jgi:L-aminopeptidase/D-esterase-like protein